jgi:hypothetical protein
MTVTPQLRAILIASALALTAAALGFYTLSQSNKGAGSSEPVLPPAASLAKTPPAATKPGKAKAIGKTTVKAPTTVATKPKPKPKPKPNAFVLAAKEAGLPAAIARALGSRPVVVVALYTPELNIDATTKAEAQAGAVLGHAGFVAANVRAEGTGAALTKLLGVLDAPSVLIFRRPGELFMKLDGYSDSQTIGQAAQNTALPPMPQ